VKHKKQHPLHAPRPPIPTKSAASDKFASRTRKETIACQIEVLTYRVESQWNNDACLVVIVDILLPSSIPFPQIAIIRSTPHLEQLKVDRKFLGQAIHGISTGVIQRSFAPAP